MGCQSEPVLMIVYILYIGLILYSNSTHERRTQLCTIKIPRGDLFWSSRLPATFDASLFNLHSPVGQYCATDFLQVPQTFRRKRQRDIYCYSVFLTNPVPTSDLGHQSPRTWKNVKEVASSNRCRAGARPLLSRGGASRALSWGSYMCCWRALLTWTRAITEYFLLVLFRNERGSTPERGTPRSPRNPISSITNAKPSSSRSQSSRGVWLCYNIITTAVADVSSHVETPLECISFCSFDCLQVN